MFSSDLLIYSYPVPGAMRKVTAQPRQVRKEAAVSGRFLQHYYYRLLDKVHVILYKNVTDVFRKQSWRLRNEQAYIENYNPQRIYLCFVYWITYHYSDYYQERRAMTKHSMVK